MSYGRGLSGCACKQASGGCGCRDASLGVVPASIALRPVMGGAIRPGQVIASPVVASTPRGVTTLPVASPQTRVLTFKAPNTPTPPSVLPTVSTTPIYQAAHQAAVSGDGDTAAQLASLATSLDQAAQASAIPTPPPPVPVVPDSPAPNASLVPIIALYGVIALALLYVGKRKY